MQAEFERDHSKNGWITAKISYHLKFGPKTTVLVEISQFLFFRNHKKFLYCNFEFDAAIPKHSIQTEL